MSATAYLVGHHISHSLSPPAYQAAFQACGIDAEYRLLDVDDTELERANQLIRADRCLGCTVTMPHKSWAASIADEADAAVAECGAANLLVNDNGRLFARNTDAEALASLLSLRRDRLQEGTALVLGAGGAAAAAIWALVRSSPNRIVVAARSVDKARKLAGKAASKTTDMLGATSGPTAMPLEEAPSLAGSVALLVNATPLGMHDGEEDPLPGLPISSNMLVYDLVYRREGPTALALRALLAGAELVDGAGHLLEQAYPAFEAWTGLQAPRAAMWSAVAHELGRQPISWS